MTSIEQRNKLQSQIWKISNEVRGAVEGWDLKQYVLGMLFYRFISENFIKYIEEKDKNINYAELTDDIITDELKDDAVKTKGYFIYPSQLFCNIAKTAGSNENLNTDLAKIFSEIENSANGYPSEKAVKGLFANFDISGKRLGNTIEEKNKRLTIIIKGIEKLKFKDFKDSDIDLFGDAYEFLISKYAANAGKSGGEFFTPQCVSELLVKLAVLGQESINKVYDPACGSGSLLLQVKKILNKNFKSGIFYGQEINQTTYNLARMNMILHDVSYDKFNIVLGDVLLDPKFKDEKPFDIIVSNPPYSIKWIGKNNPNLINDERFAPAGVLPPNSKADFAFILHSLYYLSVKGRAAIVVFPGIFYRGGTERKIRKYLVDNNFIEVIIALPSNLFYNTTVEVNILILSKNKKDTKVQFINANKEEFYKKTTKNNILLSEHIERIVKIFREKEDIEYIARSVRKDEIVKNNYDLSINFYIETEEKNEEIDINELNAQIKETVAKCDKLRTKLDTFIKEIGI